MNPIAVAEIVIVSLYLMLPAVSLGNPFNKDFAWKFANYSAIVTVGALVILAIWWQVSAKNWFKGPLHTIDPAVVEVFDNVPRDVPGRDTPSPCRQAAASQMGRSR